MAEINKLSVGQALDKMRGNEAPELKRARLDGKIDELDDEIKRLRAARRRIEQDQQASSTKRDVQEANSKTFTKPKILGVTIGIFIVISLLAWRLFF